MTLSSKEEFKDKSVPRKTYECIVNYVWINEKKFIPGLEADSPQCGIPLHYVDKAIENARRYPAAEFRIWIDTSFLKESATEFLLQSHLLFSGCTNIKIHNLNDLVLYKCNDFFKPDDPGPLWHRTDMARLIVAEDVIRKNPDKAAVYADFDVEDVRIDDEHFQKAILNHGFAVGCIKEDQVENGYFAFRNMGDGHPILSDIIRQCHLQVSAGSGRSRNVLFNIYHDHMYHGLADRNIDPQDVWMPFILHALRYKIPPDTAYDGISNQPK